MMVTDFTSPSIPDLISEFLTVDDFVVQQAKRALHLWSSAGRLYPHIQVWMQLQLINVDCSCIIYLLHGPGHSLDRFLVSPSPGSHRNDENLAISQRLPHTSHSTFHFSPFTSHFSPFTFFHPPRFRKRFIRNSSGGWVA